MNIPLVLDIALGLVFIFLILSLLASEIQEIIGTLLQWRAEHLKLSIEVLLSGNEKDSEAAAQALADMLYESPWIRGLNQEAKGRIARGFRTICHTIGRIYRVLTGGRNVFGDRQTSGPSYIPSEAFAASLIEELQLGQLWQVMVEDRLRRFVEEKILYPVNNTLNDLRASTATDSLLSREMRQLELSIKEIVEDFQSGRVRLTQTIDRLVAKLEEFAVVAQYVLPDNNHLTETFLRRLSYIQRSLAQTQTEKEALIKKLRPSVEQLLEVFDDGSVTYEELTTLAKRSPVARKVMERLKSSKVTPALKSSLISIAKKVEVTVDKVEDSVQEFGHEIEKWFDRGMERASGVYKRNARAVAFLIGLFIAISVNADTFHIASRLIKDPALRNTITQAAEQFAVDNPEDLALAQQQVDQALDEIPFPLGYGDIVLEQQKAAEETWPIPFIQRRWVGWLISAIAISMGANFWFDLLKKVISVRSSGDKVGSGTTAVTVNLQTPTNSNTTIREN